MSFSFYIFLFCFFGIRHIEALTEYEVPTSVVDNIVSLIGYVNRIVDAGDTKNEDSRTNDELTNNNSPLSSRVRVLKTNDDSKDKGLYGNDLHKSNDGRKFMTSRFDNSRQSDIENLVKIQVLASPESFDESPYVLIGNNGDRDKLRDTPEKNIIQPGKFLHDLAKEKVINIVGNERGFTKNNVKLENEYNIKTFYDDKSNNNPNSKTKQLEPIIEDILKSPKQVFWIKDSKIKTPDESDVKLKNLRRTHSKSERRNKDFNYNIKPKMVSKGWIKDDNGYNKAIKWDYTDVEEVPFSKMGRATPPQENESNDNIPKKKIVSSYNKAMHDNSEEGSFHKVQGLIKIKDNIKYEGEEDSERESPSKTRSLMKSDNKMKKPIKYDFQSDGEHTSKETEKYNYKKEQSFEKQETHKEEDERSGEKVGGRTSVPNRGKRIEYER